MTQKRRLILFLRITGTIAGSAVFCAMLPMPTMDAIHRMLGMGPLPAGPIVEYLARSTAFAYALLGALLWTVSVDIERWVIAHGYRYSAERG